MSRLAGHSLEREGRVFIGAIAGYGGGPGVGTCSCGATSPHLPSTKQRQTWHADHKDDIRQGGDGVVWEGVTA